MLSPLHRAVLEAAAEHPSWNQAADAIGMGRTKFRQIIHQAKAFEKIGQPDANFNQAAADYRKPPEPLIQKPRISIRADMPATRVLAVGDVHDSPRLPDKSRLKWIGRHAAATRPDKIVQIGDFGDFASCSTHEPPGSIGYAHKPSFRQDIESLEEALHAIYKEIGTSIELLVSEGNHEHRVMRFEELHPTVESGFYQQLQDLWARYGWRPVPFGEWHFIDGVGFSHIPLNVLGKPYGGKNVSNAIGNDATFSLVHGHDHRSGFKCVPKIGPTQSIEILDLGTALPTGYIAPYAKVATTGWTYGIYDIEIRCGHITAHNFLPMTKLEAMYGD